MSLTPADLEAPSAPSPEASEKYFFDERRFYAERSLPKLYAGSYAIMPMVLKLPVFAVGHGGEAVDATYSLKGFGHLRFRGTQLSQSDETLFLTLVHSARGRIAHGLIRFTRAALAEALGWSDHGKSRKDDGARGRFYAFDARVRQSLERLFEARLSIWREDETEADAVNVRLVAEYKVGDSGEWHVWLSPTVLRLFQGTLTYLNIAKRRALREGLATALYGLVCANNCTRPFAIEDIHTAVGSAAADMAEFGREVRKQLQAMKSAGVIKEWSIPRRGRIRVYK